MTATRVRTRLVVAIICGLALGQTLGGQASGQCILANPSFELAGSAGAVFGGWNQFGVVGTVTTAHHGARAARVSGPGSGGWDVSGFWQRQDSEPGERWAVTGQVRPLAAHPLTGDCLALVNVEWHDAADQLIDYQSFAVADAATPADVWAAFSVLSDPAPAGTASIHLLLGVLQSPADPAPDVVYDQVTLASTTYPTIDDVQWNDFPGGVTLDFADRAWRVKGPGYYGPGPNVFGSDANCVWVDDGGRLHLTLANRGGVWKSTEVTLTDALGYGDYVVTTVGRLDQLDPQAVLGLFLWQYGPCWDEGLLWWNPFNEIDIEYSRWGNPNAAICQFVAQPYDYPGNLHRFNATFGVGEVTSHAMRWLPDRVEYRVWRGGPADESATTLIRTWTYAGPHIPRPEQPRLHLNLWKLTGTPAAAQEVVIQDFTFVPEAGATPVADGPDRDLAAAAAGRLYPAAPNPLNPVTTIRFDLVRDDHVELAVYGLDGRRVRILADGFLPTGGHRTTWDGRDDAGQTVASGVYLVRLQGTEFTQSQRVVLVR
jgi:hypothetical protein